MRQFLRAALIAATVAAAVPNALAGAIHLRWAPVADADLAGYRVYWGTSSGSYSGSRDVGNVTSAAIDGLGDCTVWYLAVKAYDAAGNLSASYSNEISGWPRPALSAVAPAAWGRSSPCRSSWPPSWRIWVAWERIRESRNPSKLSWRRHAVLKRPKRPARRCSAFCRACRAT